MSFFRGKELAVQAGFIAKEKQAFGVRIQPPQGVNIFREIKFSQSLVRRSVWGELGKNAVRLVKSEQHVGEPFNNKRGSPKE